MKQLFSKPLELPIQFFRMYTIYRHPADYPGHFVVRGLTIRDGQVIPDHVATAIVDTLELAQAAIPSSADTCVPRDPTDEPQIVETWL